jgi:hypothetical protein
VNRSEIINEGELAALVAAGSPERPLHLAAKGQTILPAVEGNRWAFERLAEMREQR